MEAKQLKQSCVHVLCLASAFAFDLKIVKAEVMEPPLRCTIDRTAWCIVEGVGSVRFEPRKNDGWNKWKIYDAHWGKTVGIVLEKPGCNDRRADQIVISDVKLDVRRFGDRWNQVSVTLNKERSCELKIMSIATDKNFLAKAANSLSGSIAVCLVGERCSENILSPKIYHLLSNSRR